jgi:hypothetical protein
VNSGSNHFPDINGVIAMFHGTHDFALHISQGVRDNGTAGFSYVGFHVFKLIAHQTLRFKEFLRHIFLTGFEDAEGKNPTGFDHGVRNRVTFDAIYDQRGLKGSLHHPTGGKPVDIFPVTDSTDVKPVGDFPQNCFFGLFV